MSFEIQNFGLFAWSENRFNDAQKEVDTLITSYDDKYKPFKKVQELFAHDTDIFLNKPKIFIKNAYTFIIFSTAPGKLIFDSMDPNKGKGSYFMEYDNLRLIIRLVKPKALSRQIIQIYFLYNSDHSHLSNLSVEMNENHLRNQANKRLQQGIIVISTNIDQLAKSNNEISKQQNMNSSMMMKKN
ncbi:hypothetical protein RFI_00131 [Reticulomyxa filosa]|uniref:Uncharacterized protein n=1 Tax=Reticulomyxa filosa TaxID=46433 RepID=X6PFF7_RETFI|nr:hypothetical protein RFI_00131 [Reticulomyxa filosa]|eukprot:ETO36931.1 hypothetical protein RFI_00131 [Reticulomyxa filosa]